MAPSPFQWVRRAVGVHGTWGSMGHTGAAQESTQWGPGRQDVGAQDRWGAPLHPRGALEEQGGTWEVNT